MTIDGLARYRREWSRLMTSAVLRVSLPQSESSWGRLSEIPNFGSNPGNLRMFAYAPAKLPRKPALVVVLHGCKQDAAGYDGGTGWSRLADRYGFAVLYPEQRSTNNAHGCFNWFEPQDTRRGEGEALSIRQMVEAMIREHKIDRRRVFITGLSAGGAMTSAMLASYPEIFSGGAIIAGMPYGAAETVAEALEGMFQGRTRPADDWAALVKGASGYRGAWPRVSVWHGSEDATVKPVNAGEIVKQWTAVHGLALESSDQAVVDGYPRRTWRNSEGEILVEEYTITGMAHGTPLALGPDSDGLGAAGPFLLDAGIASSLHIARFWGLVPEKSGQDSANVALIAGEVALVARNGAVEFMNGAREKDRAAEVLQQSSVVAPRGDQTVTYNVADIQAAVDAALRLAGYFK